MNKESRSIKSIELYKNGNVKRIEFYEPTQQPQFISSVFGSPQWIAKTDEVSSGSYTTTGSTGQLRQSADCMNVPISFDFFAELNTPEEDEAWKYFQREPCYVCGKECEVMQSMMHAYTDIKVCGDCMIAHLYPFIESTKNEIGEMAKRLASTTYTTGLQGMD